MMSWPYDLVMEFRDWLRSQNLFAPRVRLADSAGQALGLATDDITGGLVTIPIVHHEVHEGEMFIASYFSASIANAATLAILLQTGATLYGHMVFRAACGGDARFQFFEGTTTSDIGGALSEYNLKRPSSRLAQINATSDPTVTDNGTALLDMLLPGGTGGNAAGGALRQNTEFILNINTVYLLLLTNISGGAKPASIDVQWYEESDV